MTEDARRPLAYGERKSTPALDDTVAAAPKDSELRRTLTPQASMRSTVLPRVDRREGSERVVVDGLPRYQAVRALGAGGQAEVTLARDHDIDRVVAVKRLLLQNDDDASILRFADEVRTVGRLEHPNIVPIHDVGVDAEGRYFFVMKYVEGETLESIIAHLRDGDPLYHARFTAEARLQICNEILRAVQHAHEQGILHRDLKPANVMIGSLGEVVVMDWGLSKAAAEVTGEIPADRLFETATGALMGTPAYMSPEQAAGRPVDERSDVYSLALMFYELLSLRHPRSHCSTVAEMIAHAMSEPLSKLQLLEDFSKAGATAALSHFVRHGLDIDPAHRYQSVKAMRERLELVRDGRHPIECHVTFTKRILSGFSRSVERHPILVGVGWLAALGGAVAGIVHLL
jgi:serine/threonine protein kinase